MGRVLVTDFDGTMTRRDYYQVFCERYLPAGFASIWDRYRAGEMTHFEAMRSMFAAAAPGEAALVALLPLTELEQELGACVEQLRQKGWETVVVSAGCLWYIERSLRTAGVELVVHSNPGRVEEGRLVMERPAGSPFFSHAAGVDKAGVVRASLAAGMVAFAGDGLLDLEAAMLVEPALRFARGELAQALGKRREGFVPFERWRDVAQTLCLRENLEEKPEIKGPQP